MHFDDAGLLIDRPGQHEQQIAESVQIDDQGLTDVDLVTSDQGDGAAFGPPADGPGQVQRRGGGVAGRKNKMLQRRQS